MNQKIIVAIFGVIVIILFGTTIYFATTNNVSQPNSVTQEVSEKSMNNLSTPNFTCGTSQVNDIDNNTYDTIIINNQCWMASNMRVGQIIDGEKEQLNNAKIERWCYDNADINCSSDGGLYTWDEAMQYSTKEGTRGICPIGWHIPTDTEMHMLENYLKDSGQSCNSDRKNEGCLSAGTKMKHGGTSGMNFPLAGLRSVDTKIINRFANHGQIAIIWSSSEYSTTGVWNRGLSDYYATVDRNAYIKDDGSSVRCLKN